MTTKLQKRNVLFHAAARGDNVECEALHTAARIPGSCNARAEAISAVLRSMPDKQIACLHRKHYARHTWTRRERVWLLRPTGYSVQPE